MNKIAFPITKEFVKQWCGSNAMYQRGLSYYQHGRVSNLSFDPIEDAWHAIVTGSEKYNVHVYIDGKNVDADCDCPAYGTYLSCKHIAAVLFEIQEHQHGEPKPETKSPTKRMENKKKNVIDINKYRQANEMITRLMNLSAPESEERQTHGKEQLNVEYVCTLRTAGILLDKKLLAIELKAGTKRPYVVKKMGEFLQNIEEGSTYAMTTKFTFDPSEHYLSQEDHEIFQILREIQRNEEFFRMKQSYYWGSSDERSLLIPPVVVDQLFVKLQGRVVSFLGYDRVSFQSDPRENHMPLTFRVGKGAADEFELDIEDLRDVTFFDQYGWMFQEGTFYKLSRLQTEVMLKMAPFLNVTAGHRSIPIALKQMEQFVSYVVPGLKEIGQVELAEQVADQLVNHPLHAKVLIDYKDEQLLAKIEHHYGDIMIDPFRPNASKSEQKDVILMRDIEKEQEIMGVFERTSFQYDGKRCYLEGEAEIYDFLFTVLPVLEQKSELYITNAAKSLLFMKQNRPFTRIDLDSGGDLLEISFDMEGIDKNEISRILQSVVEKRRYYRLSDGTFVSLEDEAFQPVNQLLTELQISKSQVQDGILRLPVYRGLQVSEIMGNGGAYTATLGKKFRRLIQELKNPDMLDFVVPEALQAQLRDYQQFGFQWLKALAHYRLGGILADDMGLGKTLQTIAYLLSEKADEKRKIKTSLVVVPASLVYNWKNEFEKYAPDLEVEVAYGTPEERVQCLRDRKPDVFITSYPLLRQDLELYENLEFDSLILDEAQAIKNHVTKTASAVKTIKAGKRFALSGTPIENSLDELWSIFDAILPGFFQSQRAFKNLAKEKIAQMVRPFILRRLKRDVLKELPEKIETVHQSELTKKQKELYVGYLEKIQQEAKESLQIDGFQKSRMKILAGLTRLRQLCCHPSLFLENYEDTSGKMEQLVELLENALENKRRLLIFSQFTSMLQIIREELDRKKIGYFYLDGQTPSKDRMEMTERFNHGEQDIFLISLKAGGTGLNLTGADTVILYDLWWNPAVEEQAAGRAHRLGQKNSVQVMRLIARGTIEEKIYDMQQKKKELIEQVIQPGETMLSSLSEAEIREILGI